jgi:hypothetical protein
MPCLHHTLLTVLVLGLGCSARAVEEDERPDAEGLCQGYCERFLECVWRPEDEPSFHTAEECIAGCMSDVRWDPACEDVMEDMMVCFTGYECPGFAQIWSPTSDRPCFRENLAYSNCFP